MKYVISLFWIGLLLASCDRSEYSKMVRAELKKGIRNDSVLLGINLGDTRNEFYGKCFDLNRQRLVRQGPDNMSVEYIFQDSLVHPQKTQIRLLFFPAFDSLDRITDVYMEWSYSAWAPWNRHLQSDSLEKKVLRLLADWYGGNEFITAKVMDRELPVKVDANRRIVVYIKDPQSVGVNVQDILHPKFKHSITK
ncbi:MAG: hypothetical protein AB7K37_10745 [Cyclobacteriaceae bacterium]